MALTAHGGPIVFLLQGSGSVTTGALVMKLKLDGTTLSEAAMGVGGTAQAGEMTAIRISITVPPCSLKRVKASPASANDARPL